MKKGSMVAGAAFALVPPLVILSVALPAALWPPTAEAQSYRCTDKNGRKHYGSAIPRECIGQPVEVLSPQGTLMRRIDPEAEAKAREEQEAAAAKKREEDAALKEQARRNRALLATYTSEKDIEDARARALEDNTKRIREIEQTVEAIKKRQARYAKEMEFYRDGGKGGKSTPPPAKLTSDIRAAELDLKLQEQAIATRRKEAGAINARYDEDKRRFRELVNPQRRSR